MHSSTDSPPDPRQYRRYDDYTEALAEWEWQKEQADDPDGSKAKDAQELLEQWARFAHEKRAPRCIPSCRKPLCLERESCIWVELQLIQDLCNEWYFAGRLGDDHRFVDPASMEHRTKRGLCSVLPAVWQKNDVY